MDSSEMFFNADQRFSRRMVLKLLGWLTLAAGMVKIPGMALAREKLEIISEFVRFPGRGAHWAATFPDRSEMVPSPG